MDQRLRALERKWKFTGSPEDKKRFLTEFERLTGRYYVISYTHTHYGRSGSPRLIEAFDTVDLAYNVLNSVSVQPTRMGSEEDAFFVAVADPRFVYSVHQEWEKANNPNNPIEGAVTMQVAGFTYSVDRYEEDDEYYLTSRQGPTIRVASVANNLWIEVSFEFNDDPLKVWWENYGHYGDYPIDNESMAILVDLGLDASLEDYEGHVDVTNTVVGPTRPVQESLTAPQRRLILG